MHLGNPWGHSGVGCVSPTVITDNFHDDYTYVSPALDRGNWGTTQQLNDWKFDLVLNYPP